jgi:adenylate cyclase
MRKSCASALFAPLRSVMERRLSVILAADIAGYSRLMERDETATLTALIRRHETIVEPLMAQHHGRIVKDLGDGVLAEFASPVEAVAFADALQKRMSEANERVPEDQRMQLRIGINLGDVMVEKDDLFGDGVNIAARLQTLAEPGGILISRSVHDQVEKKLPLVYRDLGPLTMKNIERPVHAFAIDTGVSPGAAPASSPVRAKRAIAILPFANMSDDAEQQYFSDGITEDIITELSRFKQFQVAARNSSFRYRGTDIDMVRAGRELGVDYLVEGSVRRLGGRIRITVQLIDAATGNHIWAERYDQTLEELFDVQDEVVRTIVATLFGRMQADTLEGVKRKHPSNLTAYEYVLRADAMPFIDPVAKEEAKALYQKAIELDPTYARAYGLLANLLRLGWEDNLSGDNDSLDQALNHALTAVSLDPNDSVCQRALGAVYLNRREFDLSQMHFDKALALEPNNSAALASSGFLYAYLGRPDEALTRFINARRQDPFFDPSWYWASFGIAYFIAQRYEESIAALNRSPIRPFWLQAYQASAQGHLGDTAGARHTAAEVIRLRPDFTIERFVLNEPFKYEADRERLAEGLRMAGLPE